MKRATKSVLVNLAWLGWFFAAQAVAEQATAQQVTAESAIAEQALREQESPAETEAPADRLGPRLTALESVEIPTDSIVSQAESFVPRESVCLDGGTWGACSVGPCCAVCGGGSGCPPNWYTDQEVRILTRNRPRYVPLTLVDVVGLNQFGQLAIVPDVRMNTRSLGFDVAEGYATTVGHYLGRDTDNRDQFLEFSYWGLNDWMETRSIVGRARYTDTVSLILPVTFGSLNSGYDQAREGAFTTPAEHSVLLLVGGFNRADEHWAAYRSDINNFELNLRLRPRSRPDRLVLHPSGKWRRECQPGAYTSYLLGFRVTSIDESFEFHSRGTIEVDGAFWGDVSGDYFTRTHNDLIGLQFGGEYIWRRCKWSWGLRGKAGPFINFSDMNLRVVTDATADPFAAVELDVRRGNEQSGAALLAEFGFVGTYKIRPNLILRAAYDFMWMSGVALAPEQITYGVNPPTNLRVNNNGHTYYHGISLGFQWTR